MASSRLAVISGGSKGIGRALVFHFARAGYHIATCARNDDDLFKLKRLVEAETTQICHVFRADMSLRTQTKSFGAFVQKLNTPIKVLINNAGYYEPGLVHSEPEGVLDKMLNTNLYSAYDLTRILVPSLVEEAPTNIFNICSVAGIKAYENGGAYSISKFAMMGFSKNLREELKDKGVKVTAVIPGAVLTASWDGVDVEKDRLMSVDDIASTIIEINNLSPRTVVEDIIMRPQLGDL